MSDLLATTYDDLMDTVAMTGPVTRIGRDVHGYRLTGGRVAIWHGVEMVAIIKTASALFTLAGRAECYTRTIITALAEHFDCQPELTQDPDGAQRVSAVIDDIDVTSTISAYDVIHVVDGGVSILSNPNNLTLSTFDRVEGIQ